MMFPISMEGRKQKTTMQFKDNNWKAPAYSKGELWNVPL